MSAYGHQMEREYSIQSLSSRGGSEMGSRYVVESGIYMTNFAATIFIAALVTVGVLLITLLIALTVMLQSCESKSAGIIEMSKSRDDYSYCKIFALHAELNRLDADYFPAVCKNVAIQYIKEGQYTRDLNTTMSLAENYFSIVRPLDDGLDMVLMDVDDLLPSNCHYTDPLLPWLKQYGCNDCIEEAIHLKHNIILKLYLKLQAAGWPLILISRKPEKQCNLTIKHLISAGYTGWSSLIMRLDDEMQMDSREYFSRRRTEMQKEGIRIMSVVSSQMDALSGPCLGKRIFKLPNPFYYNIDGYIESTDTLQQNLAGKQKQSYF
uniref:Acid phosphatase 1 n=1 Tax=Davidia involucrata TaxID=16924 RepID=A0A5B6YGZ6_DAVIN